MSDDNPQKLDQTMLLNMGIDPIKCNDYQILCLPENFHRGSIDELYDSELSCDLSKKLKQKGVRCANSYDLDIDTKINIRRSSDIYLGLVLILDKVVLPIFLAVIYDWFKEKRNNNKNQNIQVNKNIIHIVIQLPEGKIIKHDGNIESLKDCLEKETKL